MLLPDLVDRFCRWCQEHRSRATVRLYRGRLKSFAAMFADRQLGDLDPLQIEDWLHQADRRKDGTLLAPDTRRANRISFKRLQAWSIEHIKIEPSDARMSSGS